MLTQRISLTFALAVVAVIAGCIDPTPQTNRQSAIAEVNARENQFPSYPQANTTYLSFSQAHGFQVNFLGAQGQAWLWYPGNSAGVSEEYKRDVVAGRQAICWRHPSNSYNPVTKQTGGSFACADLVFSQKTIVASLSGDPFRLKTGNVPYRLDRCTAPPEFKFDRNAVSC